jgi:hypothetical protein
MLVCGLLLSASSCDNSTSGPEFVRQTRIEIDPVHFWPLVRGQGFYQLWLGTPAVPVEEGEEPWEVEQVWNPAAAFLVNGQTEVTDLDGNFRASFPLPPDLDAASIARALVTFQPDEQVGAPPVLEGGQALAIGDFTAPGATITTTLGAEDPEVLDKDLRAPSGSFRLLSLTQDDGETLPEGIWYFLEGPPATASLELGTELPAGYVYEGWVFQSSITSTTPIRVLSTGRFLRPDTADGDGTGLPGVPGPDFPGQELGQEDPVPQLNDGTWSAMITVERQIETASARLVPSGLRILERKIAPSDGTDIPLEMANRAVEGTLPEVFVTVVR